MIDLVAEAKDSEEACTWGSLVGSFQSSMAFEQVTSRFNQQVRDLEARSTTSLAKYLRSKSVGIFTGVESTLSTRRQQPWISA